MTIDQTANFVRGEVSASVASGDTTISVVDASIFPDPANGNYNLVIWDADNFIRPDGDPDTEVVRVTGRDTTNDDLTVSRAQENTTAVSHPSSSELHLSATAKVFTDIDTKIDSSLTITGSNGLTGGSAELGGTIDVGISGGLTLDGDLTAQDGETIWDESATYIPTARLENDAMTIAGNSVSLGGSTAINHTNISNINSDDHHQKYTDSEAISAVEGASFTSLDTADIVESGTTHLSLDGSGNVNVPNGNLNVSEGADITFDSGSFISPSTNNTSLVTNGNTWRVFDNTNSFTVAEFNEGGNVEIPNGSLTSAGGLSLGGDIQSDRGRLLTITRGNSGDSVGWYDGANNQTILEGQQGGNVEIPNGLLYGDGNSLRVGDDIQFNNQQIIATGANINYVDDGSNNRIIFDDTANSIDVLRLNRGGNVEIPNGDLTDGTNTIYDQSNSWIPQARLENDTITVTGGTDISGGSASLGGSLTVDHADTSTQGNVSTGGATVIDDIDLDGRGHVTNLNTENRSLDDWAAAVDDNLVEFGSNTDFSIFYDSSDDDLVIRDETNGVDLIRQPKQGSTEFIQGADIGSIEAPEDSFTQLANAAATSASTSGDTIGYTFAVDNQTGFEVSATSDGTGGLSSGPHATLGGDLIAANGETIWDESATEIPDSAMGSIANSTLTNNSVTVAGNVVSLGGTTAINHNDLSTISSNDHHTRYSNEEAQDAVGTITAGGTDLTATYDDAGNTLTVSHNDTSTQGNVSAAAGAAITDINLDGRGHTTSISTTDFDSRFVLESGDTITGTLSLSGGDLEGSGTEGAIEVDSKGSIADTGKAQLSRDAQPLGYVMVQDSTNNTSGMFFLSGSGGSVEKIHDSGSGTNYTTTEDNQGTTNVYYDATNARYELNNETGASVTYSIEVMKA